MRLLVYFLFILTSCTSIKHAVEKGSDIFLVDQTGKKVFCAIPGFSNWFYYVEYDEFDSIVHFIRVQSKEENLLFINGKGDSIVNFELFIKSQKFQKIKASKKNSVFESSIKITDYQKDIHQFTSDSIMLFKSSFLVRHNQMTIINDTFSWNYINASPKPELITAKVYKLNGVEFAFIRHTWSVEDKFDQYTKYKDYIVKIKNK